MLFTAGVFAAQPHPFAPPLWLLLLTIPIAAIVGDQLGFLIGRKAGGAAVFHRPSARRIGPKQLEQSRRFFDRYGPRTILLARFVPRRPHHRAGHGRRIRDEVPYLRRLQRHRWHRLGGIGGVPTLGYLLGGIGFVRSHIEVILILIVFLSVAPLLINALRSRQQRTTPAGPPTGQRLDRRQGSVNPSQNLRFMTALNRLVSAVRTVVIDAPPEGLR